VKNKIYLMKWCCATAYCSCGANCEYCYCILL